MGVRKTENEIVYDELARAFVIYYYVVRSKQVASWQYMARQILY